MVRASQREHINTLLKETITLLCKNGLTFHSEFSIEALIGITLDKHDVFLVNINEKIVTDAERSSVKHGDGQKRKECSDQSEDGSESSDSNWSTGDSPRKKRRRSGRRRKRIKKKNDQDDDIVRNQGVEPRKDKLDYKEAVVDVASTESPSTRPNEASNNVKPDLDLLLNLESAPATTSKPSHTVTRDREPVDSPDECTEPLDWTVDDIPGPSTLTTSRLQSTPGLLGDKVDDWLGASPGQDGEGGHSIDEAPIPVHIKLERVDLEGDMLNDDWNHKLNDTQQQQNLASEEMSPAGTVPKTKPYQCSQCGKFYTRKTHLIIHQNAVHKEITYPCTVCDKTFRWIQTLRRHMKIHNNKLTYVCSICGDGFTRKEYLNRHLANHDGSRPFCCEKCGKSYKLQTDLNRHLQICGDQNSVTCHLCGNIFRHRRYRDMHVKQCHEKRTTVSACEKCGKTFQYRSSLTKHINTVHGNLEVKDKKAWTCEECCKTFHTKNGLVKHGLVKHCQNKHGNGK